MQKTVDTPTSKQQKPTNYGALGTLTTVFFFWGFIAAGNSVFIPFCKEYFNLDQFQSQWIDLAFYFAYYVGALLLFTFSSITKKDIVGTWGYKKTIVYGLLLSTAGALAMILSVNGNLFGGMLVGLFIVALGFSLQQTAANPFMISLGDESTGSSRINLGGAVNSFGTTVGPLLVGLALFGSTEYISDEMIASLSLNKVIILYAFVGVLFLSVAILFGFSKRVPAGKINSHQENEPATYSIFVLWGLTAVLILCFSLFFYSYYPELNWSNEEKEQLRIIGLIVAMVAVVGSLLFVGIKNAKKQNDKWGAMKFPQLSLGMLAIFVYVGVEVAIGSNLGELLKQPDFGGYEASQVAPFVAMFWGSLMIGRWTGSVNAFNVSDKLKKILRFVVPLIALGVILLSSSLFGHNIAPFKWYFLCVLVQIVAVFITKDKPALTLGVFGLLGMLATIIGISTTEMTAIYAFLSAGLFCSIMWPCIFSLALSGLGKHQTQGAAFLVMMILGGAIIPPLQGKLSDSFSIQSSFIVGVFCFAYLAVYAYLMRKN